MLKIWETILWCLRMDGGLLWLANLFVSYSFRMDGFENFLFCFWRIEYTFYMPQHFFKLLLFVFSLPLSFFSTLNSNDTVVQMFEMIKKIIQISPHKQQQQIWPRKRLQKIRNRELLLSSDINAKMIWMENIQQQYGTAKPNQNHISRNELKLKIENLLFRFSSSFNHHCCKSVWNVNGEIIVYPTKSIDQLWWWNQQTNILSHKSDSIFSSKKIEENFIPIWWTEIEILKFSRKMKEFWLKQCNDSFLLLSWFFISFLFISWKSISTGFWCLVFIVSILKIFESDFFLHTHFIIFSGLQNIVVVVVVLPFHF